MIRIAVIGSGVAGLTAAYYLSKVATVDLIESESRLGGHTRPIGVTDPVLGDIRVDTGFIVYNDANYPHFVELMAQLKVATQISDMSFSFESPNRDVVWGSDFPGGVFAKSGSWTSPRHFRFIWGVDQFNKRCLAAYQSGIPDAQTLAQFIEHHRIRDDVVLNYVLPMTSAIWSASYTDSLDFPMASFIRFWKNHQLLELGKGHQWRTIKGSAQSYLDKLIPHVSGQIITQSPVTQVFEDQSKVTIVSGGQAIEYDAVVIATHADIAFNMLAQPTGAQIDTLGKWRYSKNTVILHTDANAMPKKRAAWCSWNVKEPSGNDRFDRAASVTYWMNRLQSIQSPVPYLVTLNPFTEIDPALILSQTTLTHPIMSQTAMATQAALPRLNGGVRVVFSGSYFGYGFHEDAVKSSVEAVAQLRETLRI